MMLGRWSWAAEPFFFFDKPMVPHLVMTKPKQRRINIARYYSYKLVCSTFYGQVYVPNFPLVLDSSRVHITTCDRPGRRVYPFLAPQQAVSYSR